MHEGKWKSVLPNYDEEQTYDDLSASFYDLIENIQFYKEINRRSEAYDIHVIPAINMTLPIGRCDYYGVLKCYCIHLADVENSFGIQEVLLKLKRNVEITIAPKNQFYEYVRKLNVTYVGPGFSYDYKVAHYLSPSVYLTLVHMQWTGIVITVSWHFFMRRSTSPLTAQHHGSCSTQGNVSMKASKRA